MTRIRFERIVKTTAKSRLPYVFPSAAQRTSGSPFRLRPTIKGSLKKISSASRSVIPCFFSFLPEFSSSHSNPSILFRISGTKHVYDYRILKSTDKKARALSSSGLFNLNPPAAYLVLARLGISNGKSQISDKIPGADQATRIVPSALEGLTTEFGIVDRRVFQRAPTVVCLDLPFEVKFLSCQRRIHFIASRFERTKR